MVEELRAAVVRVELRVSVVPVAQVVTLVVGMMTISAGRHRMRRTQSTAASRIGLSADLPAILERAWKSAISLLPVVAARHARVSGGARTLVRGRGKTEVSSNLQLSTRMHAEARNSYIVL